MNGFSQPASSQLPPGTWENGIYDYDDLKKNYLPTYTRYWDDQSKVPFLYNAPKGMWISYDDLQSNTVKNNYIIQQQHLREVRQQVEVHHQRQVEIFLRGLLIKLTMLVIELLIMVKFMNVLKHIHHKLIGHRILLLRYGNVFLFN